MGWSGYAALTRPAYYPILIGAQYMLTINPQQPESPQRP